MDFYNAENHPPETISVSKGVYERIGFISELFKKNEYDSCLESKKWMENISSKMKDYLDKRTIISLFTYRVESRYLYYLSKCYIENPNRWVKRSEISNKIGIGRDGQIYRHVINNRPTKGRSLRIIQIRYETKPEKYTSYKLEKTKFSLEFSKWYVESIDTFPDTLTLTESAKIAVGTSIKIPANINREKMKEALETLKISQSRINREELRSIVGEEGIPFLWNNKAISLKEKDRSNTDSDIFMINKDKLKKLKNAL